MVDQETGQSRNTKARFFYGYLIVAASFIILMIILGTRMSFGVYFKPILNEFGWTRALISGAFSISSIVQGFSGIIMGSLNDRLGPRIVGTLCGFLAGLGFLLMSQVNTIWQLYLFYAVIVGIGNGQFASLLSTVARWFIKRRGIMSGIVISGGSIGIFVISPITNWLVSAYNWRASYVVTGVLVLVVVVVFAQFLRRDPAMKGQRPYGEDTGQVERANSAIEGFSLKEATATVQLWMVVAVLFSFGFSVNTIMVHIVPHVTDLGISSATAANILALHGGISVVSSLVLGIVADKIGNNRGFIICFFLMSLALFWLITANEVWVLYMLVAVIGLGAGGIATLQSPLIADIFGIRSHGSILGVGGFGYTIGAAIGPFMAGYIFDINDSYQLAFLICTALAVTGLVLTIALRPIKKQPIYRSS